MWTCDDRGVDEDMEVERQSSGRGHGREASDVWTCDNRGVVVDMDVA